VRLKYRILFIAIILCSVFINWVAFAQGEQPPKTGSWGEVVDDSGNIRYDNLTDLGVIHVDASWMPSVPFIDGQATYHRYLTPSGNIVVMPSASTLFFMAASPDQSGFSQANSALGNGIGALETMLAGYLTPKDLASMGYTDPDQFFQDVVNGQADIWSFGGQDMLNFLMALVSSSLADQNLYTMLLLYTSGNCAAVPGGCPTRLSGPIPTPPPSLCHPAYIETSSIQVTGGSADGGKIAPPRPVVIGQDPERRGVDLQVKVLIPPVAYHYFEVIRHQNLVCAQDPAGQGAGCADHPNDPDWKTVVHSWYECREHTQVYPDPLASARVSISLTQASRVWILTDLAQAYPGAHLLHPDFSYSFPGPGTISGDQSVTWSTIIPRIQTTDPGDYDTNVLVRTAGTPVSVPRQVTVDIGQFTVELVRVTLVQQP